MYTTLTSVDVERLKFKLPKKTEPYRPKKPVSNPLNPISPTKVSECTMCREVFSTPSNFDRHLKRVSWVVDSYRMICTDPKEVGMELNPSGYWRMPPAEGEGWWKDEDS